MQAESPCLHLPTHLGCVQAGCAGLGLFPGPHDYAEAQAKRIREAYFDSCVNVLARADVVLAKDEFGEWELGEVWEAHREALVNTFDTLEALRVECMRTFYAVKRGEVGK